VASEVDICNLALSHLGDSATVASIDPPEGSAQAEHCARFYGVARNSMLEMHNWLFATRRKTLAVTTDDSFDWAFAYAAPAGAIKLLAVLPYGANSDDETQPYEVESGETTNIILTDQETAVVRYVALITDLTRWSPLAINALSWLLASHLAGPVLKGDAGAAAAKSCYQTFLVALGQATTSDANQRKVSPEHIPAWIKGR
jgi:hypothetical protein